MGRSLVSLVVVGAALMVGGCDEAASPEVDGLELDIEAAEEVVGPMAYDEDLDDYVAVGDYDEGKVLNYIKGKHLFEKETFDGNGRTCVTCHTRETGKLSPDEIQALWDEDPSHPIFRALDSDEGLGASYDRLRTMGTIRVGVDLPDNVTLVDDPNQRKVVFNRGIPSTLDTPALDPVLMYDGRQPDLASQANGAIHDHAAPGREPSAAPRTPNAFSSCAPAAGSDPTSSSVLPKRFSRVSRKYFFVSSSRILCTCTKVIGASDG